MIKEDFLKVVAPGGAEYAPVAGMLRSGYGFAGYFNSKLNEEVAHTFILVNARDGVSIKVGPGETNATYRAASTGEFLTWLQELPAKLRG